VFEPAVTAARSIQQEQVSIQVIRRTEQAHLVLANGLQVVANACDVYTRLATNRYGVRNVIDAELANGQMADFDRMIDELGVITCFILTKAVGICSLATHGCRDSPIFAHRRFRRLDSQHTFRVFLARNTQEDTGAIEVCMCRIEMRPSHAWIVAVNLSDHRNGSIDDISLPATLVELLEIDSAPV